MKFKNMDYCIVRYCYEGVENDLAIILQAIVQADGKFIEYGLGKGVNLKIECKDLKTFIQKHKEIAPINQECTYLGLEEYKKEFKRNVNLLFTKIMTVLTYN